MYYHTVTRSTTLSYVIVKRRYSSCIMMNSTVASIIMCVCTCSQSNWPLLLYTCSSLGQMSRRLWWRSLRSSSVSHTVCHCSSECESFKIRGSSGESIDTLCYASYVVLNIGRACALFQLNYFFLGDMQALWCSCWSRKYTRGSWPVWCQGWLQRLDWDIPTSIQGLCSCWSHVLHVQLQCHQWCACLC